MEQSDAECVAACRGDCPEAFRQLVERHQAALFRYLRGRLGNVEAAAEAAQESLVRAYFALGQLRKPDAFFCWLLGIADRVAKEMQRAASRRRAGAEPIDPAELAERNPPTDATEVAEAVARLPAAYRQVISLRYYAGLSCSEISHDLGVPLGTVTKRLSRAYVLLRERLGNTALSGTSEVTP
jgi:RNA polymerase sigma-70 factor (ECF subfamily)